VIVTHPECSLGVGKYPSLFRFESGLKEKMGPTLRDMDFGFSVVGETKVRYSPPSLSAYMRGFHRPEDAAIGR